MRAMTHQASHINTVNPSGDPVYDNVIVVLVWDIAI